jgi:hypothetical protein
LVYCVKKNLATLKLTLAAIAEICIEELVNGDNWNDFERERKKCFRKTVLKGPINGGGTFHVMVRNKVITG